MYQSVTQCLEVYKQELTKYKKWLDESRVKYGGEVAPSRFGERDFDKVRGWNVCLRGMTATLGLTQEEIAVIDAEIGFTR